MVNEKYEYLNKYSIDSTKLRVDFNKVKILNNTYGLDLEVNEIVINKETGEFEILETEIKKKTMVKYKIDSTEVYFQVAKRILNGVEYKHLYFLFSSKLLNSDYLTGINLDNIEIIYKKIIALDVIYLDYEDFLSGYLVDTDIKFDFQTENQNKFIASLKKQTKIGVPFNRYGKNESESIYFNQREKSSKTKPYIGFYNKNKEMQKSKSKELLSNIKNLADNIIRMEFTISGQMMFNTLELPNTLLELLKVLKENNQVEIKSDLDMLLSQVIYEFGYIYDSPKSERLNYDRIIIRKVISQMLEMDKTEDEILIFLIDGLPFSNKSIASKYKANMIYEIKHLSSKKFEGGDYLSGIEIREIINKNLFEA